MLYKTWDSVPGIMPDIAWSTEVNLVPMFVSPGSMFDVIIYYLSIWGCVCLASVLLLVMSQRDGLGFDGSVLCPYIHCSGFGLVHDVQ